MRFSLVVCTIVVIGCARSAEPGTAERGHEIQAVAGSTVQSGTAKAENQRSESPSVDCVSLSDLTTAPRRLHYRKPELPDSVRSVHTHGGVLVYDVRIGVSGAVTDVKLAKPVDPEEPWPTLARAWRSAILDWRYEPTTVHGRPVQVCMTTTVTIDVM